VYAKKIKQFLKDQRKVKYYSSRYEIGKLAGLSTQHVYFKLKNNNWTGHERYGLSKKIDILICDTNEEVSRKVLIFIADQKKKRKDGLWTRKKMASYLNMSMSLLYQRFDKENWKEDEILKIEKL
jgi:hypothetical protein